MGRRTGSIALTALLLLLAFSVTASAASIEIVNKRSGERITVQSADLAGSYDVDADYVVRGAASSTVERVRGISLVQLMDVAKADETYGAIQISRPGGGSVTVTKNQMLAEGLRPVIYEKGGELVFLRPSSGADDYNAADIVASASLGLTQVDRPEVTLEARVSKTKSKVGEKLTYTVTVEGGAAGAQYDFKWVFGKGGRSAVGSRVAYAFRRGGTYEVIVTAREKGSDTSSAADWIKVQVGKKVESDKRREGGGNNDSSGAPTSGAADGSSGSGDIATGGDFAKKSEAQKPEPKKEAAGNLPVVTGQVLSAASEPLPTENGLAARSGQSEPVKTESTAGIGAREGAAAAALIALGLGLLSEFGVFGALRRWRSELRGAAA